MKRLAKLPALRIAAWLLAVTLVALPGSARQLENADEPIDISLVDAPLDVTLESFAAIGGLELDLADGVDGLVTIEARSTPWIEVLGTVCRDHALFCETLAGEPMTLRVRRVDDGPFALPAGYSQSINLSLRRADLIEMLQAFGAIGGIELDIAEGIDGAVTMELRGTPWAIAMTEVCRLNGCSVIWKDGAAEVVPDPEARQVFHLELRDADLRKVLESFTALRIFGAETTLIEINDEVDGDLTIDLERVTWQEALDLICAQQGCRWELTYGDPLVLAITAGGDEDGAGEGDESDGEARGLTEPASAPAPRVDYAFTVPGGETLTGTASFTWADPVTRISAVGHEARLVWIPFGPLLSVVLPLYLRCGEPALALAPAVLPLDAERNYAAGGAALDLRPAGGDAPAAIAAKVAKVAKGCEITARGTVRASVAAASPEASPPTPKRRYRLESIFLVTPVGLRRPIAAVVDLGDDLEGRRKLALLRPVADGADVRVDVVELPRGAVREHLLETEAGGFLLRLEQVP